MWIHPQLKNINLKQDIIKYYDHLAQKYDQDRFSNSYGKYIHQQENKVLEKYLNPNEIDNNLDIACGTGRFLHFSHYGIDISPNMIEYSTKKFPEKNIQISDAENLPFENSFFKNITSFHLFMHLDIPQMKNILHEAHRVLQTDGYFIFDIPSQKRRKLTRYKTNHWHGGNQIDVKTILELSKNNWELINYHGIAFFPIHRIPKAIRKYCITLDNSLSNSFIKEYSSHLIFILKKIK